jgi:hypothetical protein
MQWFKHFSNSSNDTFIESLEDEFHDAGYAFWFKTIEIIAQNGRDGKVRIPFKSYCRRLRKSDTKVKRMLHVCVTNAKLLVTFENKDVIIECPKFAEMADNYTKYHGADAKRLQRHDKMSSPRIEENRKEVKTLRKSVSVKDEKPTPQPPPPPHTALNEVVPVGAIHPATHFIKWYCAQFEAEYGTKFMPSWARDTKIIKDLLSVFSESDLKTRAVRFLNDTDQFCAKSGYSIPIFKTRINSYGFTPKSDSDPVRRSAKVIEAPK